MNVSRTFVRFCLVGLLNTMVDVVVFASLHAAGLAIIAANFISTSLGLSLSYMLNSRFTFGQKTSRRAMLLFVGGTLFGLWLLQPFVISLLMKLDDALHYTVVLSGIFGHAAMLASVVPKLGAVGVALVWNYVWYTRVVYHKEV